MAETAFQTQYRQEWIHGFERKQSMLRMTCVTEAVIKGNTAVFLVADSGGSEAVTRGVNGLIPSRADNQTQNSCILSEWHDKPRKTGFNIFASQSDQRAMMQDTSMAVINRKIDDLIIDQLETGTQYAGLAATTMSLSKVAHALAILGNEDVPIDGDVHGLISPGAYSYLLQVKEFADSDYVATKPLAGRQQSFFWAGVNWIIHTGLPGLGTSAEECFVYHKSAIGHAMDTAGMQTFVGYEEEDDYSWARHSAYMGAKLLQNAGVVRIRHDGSGYAATA